MQQVGYPLGHLIVLQSFWGSRDLLWAMTKREVAGRYRGSLLGLLWSLFNPLLMLGVYTFVFGIIFQARWGEQTGYTDFAVTLFAGLIVFTIFAECVTRAPSLILSNVNYVKKVVFPLEILPWVMLGSTLFHSLVSVVVLLTLYVSVHAVLHWTVLLLPLVVTPLLLVTLGLSWFLAS